MACDSGPLRRTTPMPPRPGGVAIATMVSSDANIDRLDRLRRGGAGNWWNERSAAADRLPAERNDHRLQKGVANALGRHLRVLGNGEMDEPSRVGVERSHLLRRAARLRALHEEPRHLANFRVFRPTVVQAVDDDGAIVFELAPVRRVHDVL